VAAAFFPYEQGWTGAWVDGTSFGEPTFGGSSPGLATSTVNFDNDVATVTLPGVNSATDGMLFVAPSHDGNSTNIAAALPTGGGWKVVSREDEDPDTTGQSLVFGPDNDFQFLYVPYTAGGLIGGHINGSNGSKIKSAGNFNLVRNSAGEYALSVFKADGVTKRTENDGMLILSVADSLPNDSTLPDRTFLSYQYDSGSGNFVIQSRELSATTGGTENQFGNVLSLRDTDFYVAWVDFNSPLTPTAAGDFNKDGKVNADDLAVWKGSFGKDNGADADGDGDSDGADFLVWQRNLGAGVASAAATTGIPEPSGVVLLTAAGALAMLRKRFG
jgi:hypothetical protein